MLETIRIYCKNTREYYNIPCGTSLMELYHKIGVQLKYPVVAARVNYKLQNLNFLIYKPKDIEFLDASSSGGMRCYVRTLSLVMACAIKELNEEYDLRIENAISKGYFCTIRDRKGDKVAIDHAFIQAIKKRMQQIIAENRPIVSEEKQTKEVIHLFKERHEGETTLFETLGNPYCRYYRMGDYIDYYTGALMPASGYINIFELEPYFNDMLLRIPCRKDPVKLEENVHQEKMFSIFSEYKKWNKLIHIRNVGEFNKACKDNRSFEMIKVSEALHEKKVAQIADQIANREHRPKFVLISGPSSSGKTTFSMRLRIQLMVNGIQPVVISMDNYFVNREDTPRDENGEWDFEHLHALDLNLFREQMNDLMLGKEVEQPFYNFETGKREWRGNKLQLQPDQICILEGLHALNPELTRNIPKEEIFKIFVNALTTVNLDNHNWIPTADVRLIRRIVRDYNYRGYSAIETIARYESVRRGEEKWIYPYQEEADAMFNSALLFELAVLKRHAEPILAEVPKYVDEYTDAHRLLKELSYFEAVPDKEIPPTSFLREFVGGSSFQYY
ncbi:MAG: nucleoside kinase [Paludibacteraceae bacterium]|nr:nucleoside kinase [Paludibacteraceae bacterium]